MQASFLRVFALAAFSGSLSMTAAFAQSGAPDGEWPAYGGDSGSTKYSSLDQINRDNVQDLEIVWQWESPENYRIKGDRSKGIRPNRRLGTFAYEATPIKIGDVLYTSSSHSDVIAINAQTGETIWSYDPKTWEAGRPTNLGFVHRGVSYWADGDDRRVFIATGDARLIALNADTGEPIASFGSEGEIDLTKGLSRKVNRRHYAVTSPPAICRGVLVVGSSIMDGPTHKEMPPGDVRGFDVSTGETLWTFRSVPAEGEFGNDTWEEDAWKYTGNTNVWTLMSVDEDLGYVYLPFGTPTNDWYGGHRPGMGLFGESLVCVDVTTGKRVWHFQHVHHGVWDYDLCAAPALVDINVDGKAIKALAQITKQGFCWVLDRVTGEPVWPIEERPVPQSDVYGEKTWPTQPFPTKPAPYEIQGVNEDDLVDFTPELRAEALKKLEEFNHGPLYTPPTVGKPTINMPGWAGGGNWYGCTVDPETNILYIPSNRDCIAVALNAPDAARSNFNYVGQMTMSITISGGLPLWKPPYTHLTAVDLNTGATLWKIPIGDGPRDKEPLKDIPDLPQLGDFGRPFVLTTKTLTFVAHGSRKKLLYAYDKASGEELFRLPLPATPQGAPMTYSVGDKQFLIIPVGGRREPAGVVALAVP